MKSGHAHNVYKGESSDSPFLLCYQRVTTASLITVCNKLQILAQCGVGGSANPLDDKGLNKLHIVIFRFRVSLNVRFTPESGRSAYIGAKVRY